MIKKLKAQPQLNNNYKNVQKKGYYNNWYSPQTQNLRLNVACFIFQNVFELYFGLKLAVTYLQPFTVFVSLILYTIGRMENL